MSGNNSRLLKACMGAFLVLLTIIFTVDARAQDYDSLVLLVPDGASKEDPRVAAWLDAAHEEGVRLSVMQDAQFLGLGAEALRYPGFIMPDQVHQVATDELVKALDDYVSAGGRLMLVYDAGALDARGFYPIPRSRFSAMAGVEYVLYEELRDLTIGWGPVSGLESRMRSLQVPPGKSMPYTLANGLFEALYLPAGPEDAGGLKGYDHERYHRAKHAVKKGKKDAMKGLKLRHGPKRKGKGSEARSILPGDTLHAVTGYVYGFLSYPSFVTRGEFAGETLLSSPDFGLVAGTNSYGQGKVLFVNLPLGYLKGATDGMLMHGFIRYFADDILHLARLSTHPNGRGGLVFNWHVDSGLALEPMEQLKMQGVWEKGPYSIHITAGPDTITFGDGAGLDVPNNRRTQEWIRYFDRMGHEVGSHGGWIHDYYGKNANETNQAEFEQYLVLNRDAIEKVLGHPMTEYAAPEGNNPLWAMDWLEDNGFVGYYFMGHTGMAPTRTYRDGRLMNPNMWAFPVTPFGEHATFEEFSEYNIDPAAVTDWYRKMIDFAVQNRTSRLIYAHPPGAVEYPDVMLNLLNYAARYQQSGGFSWYTMTDLARFLSDRMQVSWSITNLADGVKRFTASHPTSLAGQAWILPMAMFEKPRIVNGSAAISSDARNWVVSAMSGKSLTFKAMPRQGIR